MLRNILFLLFASFILLLTACIPLVGNIQVGVETPMATEPTIQTTPDTLATEQPPQITTGTVKGKICYPSEFLPAMTAHFKNVVTNEIQVLNTVENQGDYTLELNPGTYIAYIPGGPITGVYSQAVPCGLSVDCTDHTPIQFEVIAGGSVEGIDLCDWYTPVIPPQDDYLSGLIYFIAREDGDSAYYRYGAYHNPTKLNFAQMGMVISPDGTRGLFPFNNDLYIVNLNTGEQYNLTNTLGNYEILYQWPLAETIFFSMLPEGDNGGSNATGGLYVINSDGTGLTALDPNTNVGNFAVSPDGLSIAYGSGPTASVYDARTGKILSFPTDYGITCEGSCSPHSPAWSPNGQKLAWWVKGDFNGQGTVALGLFDLSTKTVEITHPYQIPGIDGFLPAAKFSPDGKWIAFEIYDPTPTNRGIWVASVGDPNQFTETFLGSFSNTPIWSPDGKYVAFDMYVEGEQGNKIFQFDLAANAISPVADLPSAQVIDWK